MALGKREAWQGSDDMLAANGLRYADAVPPQDDRPDAPPAEQPSVRRHGPRHRMDYPDDQSDGRDTGSG